MPDPSAPRLLANVTSSRCLYNDLIWSVPIEQAQALLPPGFQARTLLNDNLGGLVINAFDCGEGFAWHGWDLFVLVQPPAMPAVVDAFDAGNRTPHNATGLYALDLYSLAAHTDHTGLKAVFEAAGMPVGPGTSSKAGGSYEEPTAAVAVVQLTAGDQLLGAATLASIQDPAGAALGADLAAHHRQWHVTGNGTWLVERVMTQGGFPLPVTQGPGNCVLDPATEFVQFIGRLTGCTLSQDVVGHMDWQGAAYFFPGVAPVA